jgi:transcriptional regulator with XRE-family HTH domain
MPKSKADQQPSWPPDADHAFVASFLLLLRDARLEQGLSVREVAQKAGIDHGIVARGERMDRIPNLITMRRWVRGLGLDWHQVYRDAENSALGSG